MPDRYDALIIGGGFYGLYLAGALAPRLRRVVVCERGTSLMQRSSYVNQARVHNGYHYPRSLLTAVRSRVNFPRFVDEFGPAIDQSFEQIYAVARRFSKVSADQFRQSMERIGAAVEPASPEVRDLFDRRYVEAVFLVRECAFNADVLRQLLLARLDRAGVEVRLHTSVSRLRPAGEDAIEIETTCDDGLSVVIARNVFCCAYAQTNQVLDDSGLERISFKHELTELALVEVPEPLRRLGVTVMDGPFFSCMPFPARGLHTLSHVRYTPHFHWFDNGGDYRSAYDVFEHAVRQTAFPHMVRDAARYLPELANCRYQESLWEVKTLLPRSEIDDSRPILFKPHHGLRNLHVILGGKIDNVYDVLDEVEKAFGWRTRP
jgi:glycine/D-amino acid oxidase-like deaminating enzyme